MKDQEHDILQSEDLKKMPYKVPEGYFETLKAEARKTTEPQYVHVNIWARIAPYAAIAAMFLFIFTLGQLFIQKEHATAIQTEDIEVVASTSEIEDYLVFNHEITDISMYYIEMEDDLADDGTSNDDVVEYLIYTGTSEEYIEYNKQY